MTWCKDIERDAAVRAAEDNRTGPLPTLEEAIAAITNHDAPPGARVSDRQCASPVDTGANKADGLRTERVVLEITYDPEWCDDESIAERASRAVRDRLVKCAGESVRVVAAAHFDDLATLAMERDAAIRERDALRASAITQSLTADRFADAVQDADKLRARVEELESQLESVSCRAATAEMALEAASVGNSSAPPNGSQAASGGFVIRGMTAIINSYAADADEKHAALATLVEAVCPGWVMTQAASGGGVDPVLREALLRDQSRTAEYIASLDEASGGGEGKP
jgi:hypothetical protein